MFITKSTARSPAPCPGPGKASDALGVGTPRAHCSPNGRESSPGCTLQRRGTIRESSPPTPQCFSRALTLSPTLTALETKARSPWHFGHSILGSLRMEQAERGVKLSPHFNGRGGSRPPPMSSCSQQSLQGRSYSKNEQICVGSKRPNYSHHRFCPRLQR